MKQDCPMNNYLAHNVSDTIIDKIKKKSRPEQNVLSLQRPMPRKQDG